MLILCIAGMNKRNTYDIKPMSVSILAPEFKDRLTVESYPLIRLGKKENVAYYMCKEAPL